MLYNHANFYRFEDTSSYWSVKRTSVSLCFSLVDQRHTSCIAVYNRTVTNIENTVRAVYSCNSWFLQLICTNDFRPKLLDPPLVECQNVKYAKLEFYGCIHFNYLCKYLLRRALTLTTTVCNYDQPTIGTIAREQRGISCIPLVISTVSIIIRT